MFIYILRNRAHSFVAENLALWPIIGPTKEASISLLLGRKQRWAVDSFTCVNWMMKLVVCEISSPHGYSKVRNTSLSFLWPRTGPHTVRTRFLLSPQKSMQLFIWAALCHSIGSGYFRDPALIWLISMIPPQKRAAIQRWKLPLYRLLLCISLLHLIPKERTLGTRFFTSAFCFLYSIKSNLAQWSYDC